MTESYQGTRSGASAGDSLAVSRASTPPIPWSAPSVFLATGLWVGRIPWAPGTWGALLGLPLTWAIQFIPQPELQVAAICLAGIPLCTAAVRRFGGPKDPGAIVFDEIASMPIVFFFVPHAAVLQPAVLAAGFVLHRIFDISKPPPARQLERLPEGLGIRLTIGRPLRMAVWRCTPCTGPGVFGRFWAK